MIREEKAVMETLESSSTPPFGNISSNRSVSIYLRIYTGTKM